MERTVIQIRHRNLHSVAALIVGQQMSLLGAGCHHISRSHMIGIIGPSRPGPLLQHHPNFHILIHGGGKCAHASGRQIVDTTACSGNDILNEVARRHHGIQIKGRIARHDRSGLIGRCSRGICRQHNPQTCAVPCGSTVSCVVGSCSMVYNESQMILLRNRRFGGEYHLNDGISVLHGQVNGHRTSNTCPGSRIRRKRRTERSTALRTNDYIRHIIPRGGHGDHLKGVTHLGIGPGHAMRQRRLGLVGDDHRVPRHCVRGHMIIFQLLHHGLEIIGILVLERNGDIYVLIRHDVLIHVRSCRRGA